MIASAEHLAQQARSSTEPAQKEFNVRRKDRPLATISQIKVILLLPCASQRADVKPSI